MNKNNEHAADDNEAMPPTATPYCCPKHLAEGWHCPAPCGQQCCLNEADTNEAMRERLAAVLGEYLSDFDTVMNVRSESRDLATALLAAGWRDDGEDKT